MSVRAAVSSPVVKELVLVLLGAAAAWVSGSHRAATAVKLLLPAYLVLVPNRFCAFPFRVFSRELDREEPGVVVPWAQAVAPCGPPTHERYVVFGGSGFVGERIVHALLLRGETRVEVVDLVRHDYMVARYGDRVKYVQGDIRDRAFVETVVRGADAVFGVCAVIRFYERLERHYARSADTNVQGYRNLMECCAKAGVKRVVITSSSGATMRYPWPEYFDETVPLAVDNAITNYARSKAEQEELCLASNGSGAGPMAVGAIRPTSLVYGFRDKNLFDRFMKMNAIMSFTHQPQEWVHVDSIVLAHLLLEAKLREGPKSPCAGQAFNITAARLASWREFAQMANEEAKRIGFAKQFVITDLPQRLFWILAAIMEVVSFAYPFDVTRVLGNDLGNFSFGMMTSAALQPPGSLDRNGKAKRLLGFVNHLPIREAVRLTMLEYQKGDILMEKGVS